MVEEMQANSARSGSHVETMKNIVFCKILWHIYDEIIDFLFT